jgi:hypothetical protein
MGVAFGHLAIRGGPGSPVAQRIRSAAMTGLRVVASRVYVKLYSRVGGLNSPQGWDWCAPASVRIARARCLEQGNYRGRGYLISSGPDRTASGGKVQ